MRDETKLRAYAKRAEAELRRNILPFWTEHTVDRERGGFYGEITNDLRIRANAPRGALLTSRVLWTYAAAFQRYPDRTYLEMAEWAYKDLVTRFWDAEFGGLFWMTPPEGTPLRPRKQIYGQAFGIYALAEYYAATGDTSALEKAKAIFNCIERYSYDPENKGYLEAFTRDWQIAPDMRLSAVDMDMDEKKSMNTHLHILEAYTNLLRVWPDEKLKAKLSELIWVLMTHIVDANTAHMILLFDEKWNARSDHVSYGHDIEASWLLVEATEALGDEGLDRKVRALAVKMAQAVYKEGLDPDGGLVYEADPNGLVDSTKQWWAQAEAVVGFLNAYQLSGAEHFLEASLRSWDFIEAYLIDTEYGEWIRYVTRDRRPPNGNDEDTAKVSFWKCPYHNSRVCMELSRRLYALLG